MVVDVEDVYDEFNFGIRDPLAMRTMMQKSWNKTPHYLLLVGDSSFDPRNYLSLGGAVDFVPTKLVSTSLMKTASDDWIADFNNNGVADVAIGRIPVRTPEQAAIVFNKITSRGNPSGTWSKSVLFLTDRSTDFDFRVAAKAAESMVPKAWTTTTIDFTNSGNGAVTSAMNGGAAIVNYIGHGSVEIWGTDNVFGSNDAAALTNGNRLPFVVTMTCLNGYFHDLFTTSMAEALLTAPNGGAIAVWGSSTLTEPDQQSIMNRELFRQLFGSNTITLGDACLRAKGVVAEADVKKSWMLFGDPSMQLR
jgi:hypothetical protein